ncbi:NADH-FMN oxidoreductase RutF, flavin reductase (DIM6/NTAB) family [Anaerobranca californiensis DSM 14826]|jgi:flavin reductase (DIM6/NTAB) family NADH-FMN oxidoreductase RutF|uniref:NADH-FMN oxidoreductase RutF, flavin reductase (DIM6/NTAB) family n=1 Tax=Anaerobranca californiensis DSM 14826 TaxID=1120989 RepID=A0A1M6LEI0_9FIRM|nr:flavin reductase family protein [Anaerobranca californiensis]SHJ69620.1 NADH-FMN oxidoreductase RutF, flavin reductase (DIM6/NTAB) family [Anaerobranca californiensis DSM 14826]
MAKIKEILYSELLPEVMDKLPKGAFLTTKYGDKVNTMTIGWGSIGIMWGKPIFMVGVRFSRHTYRLLQQSREFTISIPIDKDLKKALAFCGSKSGRDIDKILETGLKLKAGLKVNVPIIEDCELHYECKVVYQQSMEPGLVQREIDEGYYKNNDFHVLFYGEILSCYKTE